MNTDSIISTLQTIICEIIGNGAIAIGTTTTIDDIPDWDSLTHVQLSAAIEEKFGCKLSLREMMSWETIGDLAECIASKLQ